MHIEKLRIDRFGACANLQLDSLTDGLNVFLGPDGSGKRTLVYFLRSVLYGFEPGLRRRLLASGSSLGGGSVGVVGPAGRSVITRYDDGTVEGRLGVQHVEARLGSMHGLRDILPNISPTAFERLYAIDFDRRPGLAELWEEAQRCGIDVRARSAGAVRLEQIQQALRPLRDELATLPRHDATAESLRQRRRGVAAEIQGIQARAESESMEITRRRAKLLAEVDSVDRQMESLRHELLDIQRTIEQGEEHRESLARQAKAASHRPSLADRHERLQEIDSRLERWRAVLREMGSRRQTLETDSCDLAVKNTGVANRPIDPRYHLRSLESQLARLESVARVVENKSQCRCLELRETLRDLVQSMRDDVYRLCRELNTWEAEVQQRESTSELATLSRCESELESVVRGLSAQRALLLEELRKEYGDTLALPPWEQHLCGCHEHPHAAGRSAGPSAPSQELRAVEDELDRLARCREKLHRDLDELDAEREDLQEQLRAVDCHSDRSHEEKITALRAELARLEELLRVADRRAEIQRAIGALEREIEQITGQGSGADFIQNAAGLLRRMSAGNLVGMRLTPYGSLVVHGEHGTRHEFDTLSEGQRNLVYLSLCLEMVTVLNRRGVSLPIVLSGLFTHLDSKLVPETAEVMRSFASLGQQIIVLTRFEHVASVFRLLNVQVRNLRTLPRCVPVESASELTFDAVASAPAASRLPDGERRPWDAEEFPGELTDRVRLAARVAARDRDATPNTEAGSPFGRSAHAADEQSGEPSGDKTAFLLTESHSIEQAPSIDRANVDRLRKIGILRVGDLLRISPATVAAELRYAGITAEMIANWQAQARLVCHVPNLRPYDARILVACGITTPDALRGLSARSLREMVRDFASSSDGQAVLLSGTEYELSRVTEWIKAARKATEDTAPEPAVKAAADSRRAARAAADTSTAADNPSGTAKDGDSGRSTRKSTREKSRSEDRILKMPQRSEWRFYLGRRSPIVDAPSIGSRTAEQLIAVGIQTVSDLLAADADELAAKLRNRRITASLISQWQTQTILACRIPQLRGHDAQMLVAVGVTEPEQLARSNAAELYAKVRTFLETKDGKRILRNGTEPDLAEVQQWIEWSSAARSLNAA